MNSNHLAMDSSIYYGDLGVSDGLPGNLSASHMPSNSHDTSMSGMLDDSMLEMYDNIPMSGDTNTLDANESQKTYDPLSSAMPQSVSDNTEDISLLASNTADSPMTGAGAGPLPTGFGAQSTLTGGSTLTEFTKRRNWSQKVVEELRDFLHILTPDGRIVYISPSGEPLTGYQREELIDKFLIDYIHPDDSAIFMREFNESIASGNPLRFFYRFKRKDGTYTIFESHGHPHLSSEASKFGVGRSNSATFCKGVFMMARPYPTKNAALLDSFLEHKIENERLRKRIDDLRREEAEEQEECSRTWTRKQDGSSIHPSDQTDTVESLSIPMNHGLISPDALAMPPPAKPPVASQSLTRQALEDVNAGNRPDSITDKMARYEGATDIETIEMLTGLQYQEGERSCGISTGDQSPALVRGDAGIAIPIDKEARANDKKKKIKLPDEYVCTDCGTLDSPEWRKGPSGPKTLCNACGLRWAKKEKKSPKILLPPSMTMITSTGSS